MKSWLELALRPSVVKRALKYALVVGATLITINHSDALLRGDLTVSRCCRMGLTVVVPYIVSTLSSVGALREREQQAATQSAPPGIDNVLPSRHES